MENMAAFITRAILWFASDLLISKSLYIFLSENQTPSILMETASAIYWLVIEGWKYKAFRTFQSDGLREKLIAFSIFILLSWSLSIRLPFDNIFTMDWILRLAITDSRTSFFARLFMTLIRIYTPIKTKRKQKQEAKEFCLVSIFSCFL